MGPRGPLTLNEQLVDIQLLGDCNRRKRALEILQIYGVDAFAKYVVEKNVALHRSCLIRKHDVRSKFYLLRNEDNNDNFFVKAILNKKIPISDLMKIFTLSKCFDRLTLVDPRSFTHNKNDKDFELKDNDSVVHSKNLNNIDLTNTESFEYNKDSHLFTVIKVKDKLENNQRGICGPVGQIGPGDDGYGGSYCGAAPAMRQYINDPYFVLMALFIRGNTELIDFILSEKPKFKFYLEKVMEMFLIDEDNEMKNINELKLISKYVSWPLAYNFMERKLKSINQEKFLSYYTFLKGENYLAIPEYKIYYIKSGLRSIWSQDEVY